MPTHVIRARAPRIDVRSAVVLDRSTEAVNAHLEDAAHFPGGHAEAIARPRNEAEVSGLVQMAARLVPIGAQSSVTGGATPDGGLILSTDRLSVIHEPGQSEIRVEAGVPLETLQKLLTSRGRWYAPVPTFAGAFVGGVVATNAAGAATFKYGPTRPWVLGLTVVLACGCVLELVRGDVRSGDRGRFQVDCLHGSVQVRPGTYRMPDVPKCSAGYFAAPDMDLIDLFIGSEGTLGVIVDATLKILPSPPAMAFALIPVPSESKALALVDALRRASMATWRDRDPRGIDIAAIESLDRRCLDVLHEDGADRKHEIALPSGTEIALIVQLELPADETAARAFDEIADALAPDAPDVPLVRFCRALSAHDVLEQTELAMPGDQRRAGQLLAFREAAPMGVNRRVGDAKRLVDGRIDKTAGDMVVPFARLGEMMAIYRDGYARRGLDCAIWGHFSDGNVHPNVIPQSYEDVLAGREATLEFGREAARLGGCPLAEHGVGRSSLKQALLRQFYGDRAIDEMRAIKHALDPDAKLAPGVIFPVTSTALSA